MDVSQSGANPRALILERRQVLRGFCTGPLWYICGAKMTVQAVIEIANLLEAALSIFDNASAAYQTTVMEAVSDLKSKFKITDADRNGIAQDWDSKRIAIAGREGDLRTKFTELTAKANTYWGALDQITSELNQRDLRESEQRKNSELHARWDKAYAAAQSKLSDIDIIRSKSEDIGRLLAIAAMRADLSKFTDQLDSMTKEADAVLASLQAFSKEGKAAISFKKAG